MSTLADMLAALGGAPSLPGARCRGRPHLFDAGPADEPVTQARHAQAAALCGRCPSRAPCARWLHALPPSRRPHGIVAGCRVDDRGRITPTHDNERTEKP